MHCDKKRLQYFNVLIYFLLSLIFLMHLYQLLVLCRPLLGIPSCSMQLAEATCVPFPPGVLIRPELRLLQAHRQDGAALGQEILTLY